MGRFYLECLGGQEKIYNCAICQTYLTNSENLISTNFRGSSGAAYLFKLVVNIEMHEAMKKDMITGLHIVRDIGCKICKKRLGWMYELAMPEKESYKEGHFILECSYIRETDGLEADPNFNPYIARRNYTTQGDESARNDAAFMFCAPTAAANRRNSESTTSQQSPPINVERWNAMLEAAQRSNAADAASINEFAAFISGIHPQFNAQAFVDATAAVASANIARRSGARLTLNRAISNSSNTANISSNSSTTATAGSSAHNSSSGNVSRGGARHHLLPITSASAQMARRTLRNITLPLHSNSASSGRSSANSGGSARTRQSTTHRQPSTSSSRASTTSITSSSGSVASMSFVPGAENASISGTSTSSSGASSHAASATSSSSTSPDDNELPQLMRRSSTTIRSGVRRLSIELNPIRSSISPSEEDERQLRSGRRISRTSGSR